MRYGRTCAQTCTQLLSRLCFEACHRDRVPRVLLMHEPFSLLVPVYDGDRPDYLRRAFRSAVQDQTVRPDQVIIVRDGPVRAELAECLEELCATSPVPVTFVPLPRNGGLGP